LKIVYQTTRRAQPISFQSLTEVFSKTLSFNIGSVDKQTGERAEKWFTGVVATSTEPFPVIFQSLRSHFAGRNIVAYLDHEGNRYSLNAFTTARTEEHSLVKAADKVLRALDEANKPTEPTAAAQKVPMVAIEQTVSYDFSLQEMELLRKSYPEIEIKLINTDLRTVTLRLGRASIAVPKQLPANRLAAAS